MSVINYILSQTSIAKKSVETVLKLSSEGATIPFLARYRKEATGGLDELQIGEIIKLNDYYNDLEKRKETILSAIAEQGKLTPELKREIENCMDSNRLEDLYLPYKKRKKTRADLARERGLEPLAKVIMAQQNQDLNVIAKRYITKEVVNGEDALQGARDIIAEWINETIPTREYVRETLRRSGFVNTKVVATKKAEAATYTDYFEASEKISKIPSHRLLAMLRGTSEGFLRMSTTIDDEQARYTIYKRLANRSSSSDEHIQLAVQDAYKRLLYPSVENQVLTEAKEKADKEAIDVFAKNLRQLLLAAPLGAKSVLAIDPGFRSGCKIACIAANGDLLQYTTIYPTAPQYEEVKSGNELNYLIDKYSIDAIAIGNGTASRETEDFVKRALKSKSVAVYVVSENGASIYSASEAGREEFPDLDATVRGAISIGRRLIDPLAELVKIDPKSIGVGQYQHDVNQTMLKANLDQTVSSVVNSVGVDINTASPHLLQYIAGLGPTIANNIVKYRTEQGEITSIASLKKVPRLGDKAFEQCAGFLRVRNGDNPLDNTGVHPESYGLVAQMAKDYKSTVSAFVANKTVIAQLPLANYAKGDVGMPTLIDIQKELLKPGHDPRGAAKAFSFDESVKSINDLSIGKILPGIVGNMTNFGAFVDIGIKENGLLHISQITNKFISNPAEVLTLGMHVTVKVLEIDVQRKRISLTMKF